MATITEDYCSNEIYRLLLKKGFEGEIHTTFDKEGYTQESITLQMAIKWLREVHNIIIVYTPSVICSDSLEWISSIRTYNAEENYLEDQGIVGNYDTYEEACEAAIKYCLENLI